MLTDNTILQNRYRVLRELGRGGMGTVYEALDQRINCIVALKETLAASNEEARRAFEREAALLGNLRHSALPKVMDYFSENDGDFLVMEFIPGYDLAELLDLRSTAFPQAQILRWADELLKVLEYLHRQQPPILHRDIKPSNLKLTKQGEIFLLDFGLAKGAVGQMPTFVTSRSVRGYTPVYASLEQILGHGTDARSDLYSLSATLYHLLAGVPPVDAPTRFHAIEDEQPDPLQSIQNLNPLASTNIVKVIHQAMAVTRKQRLPSAAEMRKALRSAAEEDERSAAEEEYRRADETHEQREHEKRNAPFAETRKKEELQPRKSLGSRGLDLSDEKVNEQKRQVALPQTHRDHGEAKRSHGKKAPNQQPASLPGTVLPPPPPTMAGFAPNSSENAISQPAIKTMPAPPPERLITNPESTFAGTVDIDRPAQTPAAGQKRALMAAAVVATLIVVGAIGVWLGRIASRDASSTEQPSSSSTNSHLNTQPLPTATSSAAPRTNSNTQTASQTGSTNADTIKKTISSKPTRAPAAASKRTDDGGAALRRKRALDALREP